ncbi:Flagellar assembly protein FliH [Paraglaciecola mesophila]|uniref:Flagellar assembly protein FliH n=1 Tax=Paraglaciecola mesophila TaxID=197222 RepID=A0A857JNE0_9ALTE|nr:flagellar assembly protein FliH [Paraglaciecola mesophila]QHJ13599.1 Flagellar assembly protein FliH [Paraglaciecola mesophila]
MNKYNDSEQDKDISAWDLPFVEDQSKADSTTTNALNRRSNWKYEPPENQADEEEEFSPPTAQEIESIREAAQGEGFEAGKQEGLEKGHQEGFEQGKEQGFEQGLEEGRAQGLAEAQETIHQQLESWQSLLSTLHQPVALVEDALQKELVSLAVSLAKSVIRAEVKTNSDIIFNALSEGLKALPINEKQYQIHLHPEDLALVTVHFSEQEIEKHGWQLVEAPNLSQGGCDIVTQSNAVDVSIERRVKDVLDKFLLEQGLDTITAGEDE